MLIFRNKWIEMLSNSWRHWANDDEIILARGWKCPMISSRGNHSREEIVDEDDFSSRRWLSARGFGGNFDELWKNVSSCASSFIVHRAWNRGVTPVLWSSVFRAWLWWDDWNPSVFVLGIKARSELYLRFDSSGTENRDFTGKKRILSWVLRVDCRFHRIGPKTADFTGPWNREKGRALKRWGGGFEVKGEG